MDSGNSGSLQSSSASEEDEDYDSSSRVVGDTNHLLLPSFSSSSSHLNFANNIMIPHLPNSPFMHPPSSHHHHHHHLHVDPEAQILNQSRSIPPPSSTEAKAPSSPSGVGLVVTKNPKKRTRASRRAPTTVLSTDTTNFRAMVQEFTGVPSPPFSTVHSLSSLRRFDVFRSPPPPPRPPSSSSSCQNLDSLCNPFRNTAQKFQTFIPSSSSSSVMVNHHHPNIVTSMASPTVNFHFLPDLPLPKLPLLETQNNQVPTFQSLVSHQQHHQPVSSLHELNPMNLESLRQDQEHDHDQDQEHDRDHHHHRFMIRQVDVPLSEFDRGEKLSVTNNNNVSSSLSSIKGTNTATTTTADPWICPTD